MIDVIIPVYRGLAQTRRCLDSVLASRVSAPHEVVVIDDASPEPELCEWLRGVAASGRITLLSHATNRGFVVSANEGMQLHADRDVVLLNSDTEVAEGWLDRLAACAARDPQAGTVTPFSNNATICSFPDMEPPHPLPQAVTTTDLDRLFQQENAGLCIELPTAVGFCMLIRRACLEQVGEFDVAAFGAGYGEEVDFCLRASRAGWRHQLAADVFVFHEGSVSFGSERAARQAAAQALIDSRYPEFVTQVRDFILRDPAGPARDRVAARLACLIDPHAPAAIDLQGIEAPMICVCIDPGTDDALAEESIRHARRGALLPPGPAWVLSDASPAERLRELLATNRGRDVVFLCAGVQLPRGWDARLLKALHSDPAIGGVSPLVTGDTFFAPLPDDTTCRDVDALDAAAFNAGDRRYYEAPTLAPACSCVRADQLANALDMGARGATAAELIQDVARHIRRNGRSCAVLDHLVVPGPIRPGSRIADPIEATAFLRHSPLGQLRRTLGDMVTRGLPRPARPGLDARPVRLHVTHYWGGGIERWVRDFARADAGALHLTFASYRIGEDGGQRFELRSSPTDGVPCRTWDLAQPFRTTGMGSIEYRRLLREVISDFCVDSIVVSSLIGHDLAALETELPTLMVLHDLYPACQAINPSFRGQVCTRCTRVELESCQRDNPLNLVFRDSGADDWLALRSAFVERLLRHQPAIVVPSPWVRQTLLDLEPALASLEVSVLGHGIDERQPRLRHAPRTASERLRLAVVGRMSEVKGAKLLKAAAKDLSQYADIWVIGEGKAGRELAEACNWHYVPTYKPETLGAVLSEVAPHAAILPSVVPETFSYTLSELLNLGVVPLVTRLGSFVERVSHGNNGFVFDPDPHHLVALARVLHDEPHRLTEVAARLASKPPQPTTGSMVEKYRKWLPCRPLAAARYPVGVGAQTGLSEPYRHLSRAYADLQSAYETTRSALGDAEDLLRSTRTAHEQLALAFSQTQQAYEQARDALAQKQQALDAIDQAYKQRTAALAHTQQAYEQTRDALSQKQQALDSTEQAYRQTRTALANMQQAYEQAQAAYRHTNELLQSTQVNLELMSRERKAAHDWLQALRIEWQRWMQQLDALDLRHRPWRIHRSVSVFRDGRERLNRLFENPREE